jgi:hypothetical protein
MKGLSLMTLLGYVLTAIPYLVASALGVLLPALGALCYARFGVGLLVIFGMYAIEALFMEVAGIQLGIALYVTDFALIFMGAVALLRLLSPHTAPRRHWAWLVFALGFLVSLGLGLASFGSTAGVQARPYFYFLVTWSYGLSFEITTRHLRLALNSLVVIAVLLLFITAYRWVVYYLPIRELLPEGGSYNVDGPIRVIRSFEALVIAEVLVIGLLFHRAASGFTLARILSPLLLACVVVLQHRSVWVATFAGLVGAILVARSRAGKSAEQVVLAVVILADIGVQVGSSASSALDGRGTTGERVESWKEIVSQWAQGGPRSILIGQSFGSDPTRYVHDQDRGGLRKISYTAHNFYVQTLSNMGLLGLGCFLVAATYTLRGLYRICAAGTEGEEVNALLVLIIMQLVYYVPYGTDYLQSLLFGIALAYVAVHERKRKMAQGAGSGEMRPMAHTSR